MAVVRRTARASFQLATSEEAAALVPLFVTSQLVAGVPVGVEVGTRAIVRYDPLSAYAAGLSAAPSLLVVGAVGRGKSALVKTIAQRARIPVYVVDPKGEYGPLAAALGLASVRIDENVGANPLAAREDEPPQRVRSRRVSLLASMLGVIAGEITPEHEAVLGGLVDAMATTRGASWDDLLALLESQRVVLSPFLAAADRIGLLRPLALAADAVRSRLGAALGRRGLGADGHTRAGIVADLSPWVDADERTRLLAVLLALGLLGPHLHAPGPKLLIVDEAWLLLEHEAGARWLAAQLKLARQYQLGVIIVTHQLRELGVHGRSEAARGIAARLAADVGAVAAFGAPREAVAALGDLGLSETELGLVESLGIARGLALLHVARDRYAVVRIVADEALVETDRWRVA